GLKFTKDNLIFLPELKLYGFPLYFEPYDSNVWWFNSDSGEYIDSEPYPDAINTNGIYVSQADQDCDFVLDLQFLHYDGNIIHRFASYMSTEFNVEGIFYKDKPYRNIFWYDNNVLFMRTHDYHDCLREKEVFLKIKIQPPTKEMH
ncbi:MAG: hypothetical protein K2J74_08045, partial [Muribaculaceae bacterium]|nr:hypothetical protein [Muribaculaceae bacterium]